MPNYRRMTRRAARRHGLNPAIFERQIQQESGFAEDVITGRRRSSAGAQGIAQIMPDTARGWGVNPLNPREALNAAASHMASYVKQYGGYENALRAYNAGPGNIKRSKGFSETNRYVSSILRGRDPHGKLGVPQHEGRRGGSSTTTTTTTSTPGVDNRVARAELIMNFLSSKGSDPLEFAVQARALRDIPASSSTSTKTVRSGGRSSGGGGGGGKGRGGSDIKELIWAGPGSQFIDNGQFVAPYAADQHRTHVHLAAGPKTTDRFGRQAQRMGLHVGENPDFGGVTPVHTTGSWHYSDRAIDVSGDPAKMRRFAKRVARYQRRKR